MNLVDDPDERLEFSPACCRGCGAGLAGAPVLAQRRHQVTDIGPVPPPTVTEYVAQAKACPCRGIVSEAVLPGRRRLPVETTLIRGVVLLEEEPEHAGRWQSVGQRGGLVVRARLQQAVKQEGRAVPPADVYGRRTRYGPQPVWSPPLQVRLANSSA